MKKQEKPKPIERPNCPEDGTHMAKYGTCWSGRHKLQRWQCKTCGRVVSTKIEDK